MQDAATRNFCLIGYPITFSLSPLIYNLFAQQIGVKINYAVQRLKTNELAEFITYFFKTGGSGLNITAPYKEIACNYVHKVERAAQDCGAINNIYIKDGQIYGANTDTIGFAEDLLFHDISLHGKQILILGAGGATRGILPACFAQDAIVYIANRTSKKVQDLTQGFSKNINCISWDDLAAVKADVIIHAISSFAPEVYAKLNFSNAIAYDLNYAPNSVFLDVASNMGAKACFNGLGMLIEQAAAAFFNWYSVRPHTREVRNYIANKLAVDGL